MTRVQKERFFNEQDYIRLKDTYILDLNKLEKSKSDLIVMHPLPRVNEIAIEVELSILIKFKTDVLCVWHLF